MTTHRKRLTHVLICTLLAMPMLAQGASTAAAQSGHAMQGMDMSGTKAIPDMPGMDMPGMAHPAQPSRKESHGQGSMDGMDMSGSKDKTVQDMPGMNMSSPQIKDGHKMPGMDMPKTDKKAPPVGSLPRSDGSAGHSNAYFGIDSHTGVDMAMDDNPLVSKLMLDQFEYVHGDAGDGLSWDGRWRIGRDLNRLWIRSEGSAARSTVQEGDVEALWGHAISPFWDLTAGARHDFGEGPARNWAALGVQGLAPYMWYTEATAYLGPSGRTAARLRTEYDLLLTQRLILTPELETNLYGRDDPERGLGAGLSDAALGFRLRYEFRRQFGPYLGVQWTRKFGKTAEYARQNGTPVSDQQFLVGLRLWY